MPFRMRLFPVSADAAAPMNIMLSRVNAFAPPQVLRAPARKPLAQVTACYGGISRAVRAQPVTRRQTLRLWAATAAGLVTGAAADAMSVTPAQARRKPSKSLITSLVPIVRTRESLVDLKTNIENGSTNRDLRRVLTVLLTGAKLPVSVRDAVLWLPLPEAEKAEVFGKDAVECVSCHCLSVVILLFTAVIRRRLTFASISSSVAFAGISTRLFHTKIQWTLLHILDPRHCSLQ
jgi:hypothetical protein